MAGIKASELKKRYVPTAMTGKRKRLSQPPTNGLPEDDEPVDDLDEAAELIPYTYSITSYGADYPVDSLVKRIDAKDILVPKFSWEQPKQTEIVGFQREYVWPRTKADRFIESLLLGLPVPGIFLVKEASGVLLVLDGHQRLYTLNAFYEGVINGQEYRLANVQERFDGKRYKDLDTEDRRRLDDSIIHATIVRQDMPTEDQSSIYVIFERLNTGGVNLQPQEIRVALYHGEFVRVLQNLNEDDAWRKLYGKKSRRLKDMEMILRFFAFLYYAGQYRSPMKDFLNRYMATNRHLQKQPEKELCNVFTKTTETILTAIGAKAFRPQRAVNAAVVDSLMTGVAKRVVRGKIKDYAALKRHYDALIQDKVYSGAVETGTAQEANVKARLRQAEEAFAQVP
ncbi:MAG TPA: DUF262 domain-containing protein [Candidatus Solibacter sp.]|nr:DUF262 domain-containing protein [Candidatus Solibacter sp.]